MKDYLSLFQESENSVVKVPSDLLTKPTKPGFVGFVSSPDEGFQTEIPTIGQNPESEHWKADCAELFAEARAKVETNLANGACPDCGSGLIENKLGAETLWYCAPCDFTWRASDFAEIRAILARHKPANESINQNAAAKTAL